MVLPCGLAPSVAEVWTAHRYARVAVIVLGSYDVVFGLVLALSGPVRTSSASFATIRQTGGPVAWGAALAVLGVLVFAAALWSRQAVAGALGLTAGAHLFLMGGFVFAARTLPDAALTGIPTYALVSAVHVVQCLLHRRPRALSR